MAKTTSFKKIISFAISTALAMLALAVFNSASADLPPGVTQEQIDAAIKDLTLATGQAVTTIEQAGAICDSEKYFTTCAEVGKKHNLYEPAEIKHVDNFISEIKGVVADKLTKCETTECLLEVANELAKKVVAKSPT